MHIQSLLFIRLAVTWGGGKSVDLIATVDRISYNFKS